MKQEFETELIARGPKGAWTFMRIPFNVEETFGSKARVAVCGTINGFAFRNSLMPEGDGTHAMAVSKELQAGARAKAGDRVTVVLELYRAVRTVDVPLELAQVLSSQAGLQRAFDALSPSHRREFAEWISSAKKPETRQERARKAIDLIVAKKHAR